MEKGNLNEIKNECCCKSEGLADGNADGTQCCSDNTSKIVLPMAGQTQTLSAKKPAERPVQVSTQLTKSDILGAWKVRWGINRMKYTVNPGLYYVGNADKNSPVFVTANYKLSFDMLRKELSGMDAWILVLDTKGINVWCAAGKGTFGTNELIKRIYVTELSKTVAHKTIILPQLGAPGVSAAEVQKITGFKVIYGPVRACDIKEFMNNGMKATKEMREVKFTFADRLVLTPVELVSALKVTIIVLGILFILNLFANHPFGLVDFYGYLGALLVGCFLVPALLPWVPGRAFAWKGWLLGVLWAVLLNLINGWPAAPQYSTVRAAAYLLILPAVSAFYAMNFTGASTYTSLSGVLKEMKMAVPAIAASIAIGTVLILVSTFIPGM